MRPPVSLWRKVVAIVFLILVVGPLLYAMFASYFTKGSFGDIFGQVAWYWPYLDYVVPLAIVVGLYDLWRRFHR
jgi:hypothetical protein